jgi:hypothetical protein
MPKTYIEINGQYPAKFIRGTYNYSVYQVMRADKPFIIYIPRHNFRSEDNVPMDINIIFRPGIDKTRSQILDELTQMQLKIKELQQQLEITNEPL